MPPEVDKTANVFGNLRHLRNLANQDDLLDMPDVHALFFVGKPEAYDLRDAVVRGERSRILEMNGWIKRSLRHGRHFSLWGSAVINPTRTDGQPRQNNGRMQTCRRTRQVYDLTCRYDSRWDPMLPEKTAASMHHGPWGCRAAFRHLTDIHVFLAGIGKPASRLENKVSLFQFHSRRVDTLCRLREHRGRECKTASRRKAATDMSRRAQNNGCPIHQPIRQIYL